MKSLDIYMLRYLRRLYKEFAGFIPLLVICLIVFNFVQKPTIFETTKNKVLKNPKDQKAKLVLANLLYQNNNFETSEIEIQKILKSKKNDWQTKQAAVKLQQKISTQKNNPPKIREEIKLWSQINKQFPNSRDVNLKLASLNWKLYRLFEANKNLTSAKELDPNSEVVKKFSLRLR